MKTSTRQNISIRHEVPFHDTDLLGVAWHGHYYKYFEIARTRLLRSIGLDGENLVDLNVRFLVAESHCQHVHPLAYGEVFDIAAWIDEYRHRIKISFEITSCDQERRCAFGYTNLVTVDSQGRLLIKTPQIIQKRIQESLDLEQ